MNVVKRELLYPICDFLLFIWERIAFPAQVFLLEVQNPPAFGF